MAHPRLLRLGQPQRQGDLSALHRLVRRQPRAPLDAPARSRRPALRARPSAASTPPSPEPASSSTTATCASPPSSPATPCSPHPTTPAPARSWRPPSSSSATAPRTPRGATASSPAPTSCAPYASAHRPQQRRTRPRPHRHPALRLGRHPHRRTRRPGTSTFDRLAHHRPRRALPHGAQQRRADPPPRPQSPRQATSPSPHPPPTPRACSWPATPTASTIDGDASVLTRLVALTDNPDPDFAIVTP